MSNISSAAAYRERVRKQYADWLRTEIDRIYNGGTYRPGLSRDEKIARLRTELAHEENRFR
jgi:hypothetical protein